MKAIKKLMKEHQLILKYVDLMKRYTAHAEHSLLLNNADSFIAFIHEFADSFHHAKEEDILFNYLIAPDVLTHCNPIPQMLLEHNKARKLLHAMKQAKAENNFRLLATAFNQYAQLLTEHIFKEDNILYPMAERSLPDEIKTSLEAECAKAEQRFNSPAIWKKYQALYQELAKSINLLVV